MAFSLAAFVCRESLSALASASATVEA